MSTIKIIGDAALSASIEFEPSGAIDTHVALSDPHTQYELESANTAAAILTKLLTVDGAGSGLDADLLDGNSSAAFLRASGAATGATSSRQVFTNGIALSTIRPIADSIASVNIQSVAGDYIAIFDTVNLRMGLKIVPEHVLDVNGTCRFRSALNFDNNNSFNWYDGSGTSRRFFLLSASNYGYLGFVDAGWGGKTIVSAGDTVDFRTNGISGAFSDTASFSSGGAFFGGLTTATAAVDIAASTTARASLRLRSGTAPTSPNNGDVWFDGTDFKCRIGGVTKTFTVT